MLTLDTVTKKYGSTVAVDGLSLAVARGEIFGLLGPNGAGKSTTVHLAVGLLAPDTGRVSLEDETGARGLAGSPRDAQVRRRIGIAPQTIALYDLLSADENLRFFGRLYGLSGATLRERVDWALGFVGLTDRRGDRVQGYSGGMRRRLNLAASILHQPDLVLFDEPTAGVDPQSRNLIIENVQALRARGCTIVYTTHYMEEAERLCDRVAIVDRGRVLAIDTVPRLLAAHGGPAILVVETPGGTRRIESDDPLAALNRVAAETSITRFHVERATLEQVFLNLTGRTLRD
jgi:ABC-2 type transport system ATP-binding protein